MNEALISVIVPVFNAERWLRECLDSLLAQTWVRLEVILVDDGSTDGSPGICREYARKDKRIKLLHGPNMGVSKARQRGVESARGSFIGFVDSDDVVLPTMFETLYRGFSVTDNVLMTNAGLYRLDRKGRLCRMKRQRNLHHYVVRDVPGYAAASLSGETNHYLCTKLFRREVFDWVRFHSLRHDEDTLLGYELVKALRGSSWKIVDLPDLLYCYRDTPGSLCTSETVPQAPERLANLDRIYEDARVNWPELCPLIGAQRLASLTYFLSRCRHIPAWKERYWSSYRPRLDAYPLLLGLKLLRGKQRRRFIRLKMIG